MATSLQLVTTIDPFLGPPASGGGNSMNPIITPDGRYVLFASTADNLALTSSNTPFLAQSLPKINVFLRDRTNGTTILVSVNLAGTSGGNGDSIPIELSTNGQFTLFESSASDLVPGDTNNATDVFVRDLVNGTNILVSIGADGGCANGVSGGSAMTPDGRYVAFASTASNLVPGDTNGIRDIFVRDLVTGVTTLASPGATGPGRSDLPQLTPDGRYVAFLSTATNLVPGVATTGEVYVRDLTGAVTYLASGNAHSLINSNAISYNQAISDNGQFVAFESSTNGSSVGGVIQRYHLQSGSTDIVYPNAAAIPTGYTCFRNLDMTPDGRFIAFVAGTNSSQSGIYLWDAQTATATLVSGDTNNVVPTNSVCDWSVVDPSGRFVVFLSTATGLTTNVVAGDFHLYLRDLQAGSTLLLDADTNGFGFPKDFLSAARLTPDGRFLAFDCTDEYPATNTYNQPSAFADRSLVPNDNNHACDVFVRDLTTNTIELISVRQPALPSQSPADSSPAMIYSVDTGGRYIAFASASTRLVPNDTNTFRGVFVHDLLSGTNLLVSADTNGFANANALSTDPFISGDGRYVAFTSFASNLVAGYTWPPGGAVGGAGLTDVFVRDLQTGVTRLVSVSADGNSAGNSNSCLPVVSADGRYVLFHSWANNLSTTGISGENLSLRDLQSGTTYILGYYYSQSYSSLGPGIASAMTPDGHFVAFCRGWDGYHNYLYVWDSQAAALVYTNSTTVGITNLAISPDGNRIVFNGPGLYAVDRNANTTWQIASLLSNIRAGLQFSGDSRFLVYSTTSAQAALDTNGVADVYLYDFMTRSNFLVSQSNPPGAASGPSDSPVISNDGRFVAYRSTATNLVAGATNGLPNVFLYDRQTGTTTLLSVNASGMAGNNRSFAPQFSGDGETVVFQSWASDLVAQDFNQVNDLFAVKIATLNPTPPTITSQPVNQAVPSGNSVTFSVWATGSWPVSYQWNYNGTDINGATNATLTLTNVQLNQAGDYAVLLTNAYGSVLSSNAILTVLGIPPGISTQPTNWTTILGGTASFSVVATGSLPLCYQWSFNGANISGATNTTLTLTNVQPAQAGNYAVLVTNAFGSILSSNAMLWVQCNYTYTANNGTIIITGYTGSGGSVTIPATINGLPVTSIGSNAFYFCTSLTNVTIPSSVTSIGEFAFAGTGLTGVTIPNSVTSIGTGAFAYCSCLTAITVDTNNPAYSSLDGVLFDKNQTTLIAYPNGLAGSYTIPNRVTSIGDYAFLDCWLTSVTIPNSVTSIGEGAFAGCGSLSSVLIPNSVTNIGDQAFLWCINLSSVSIGNSVTNIGDQAFAWCTSLTEIVFQGNAPGLGWGVFCADIIATVYYLPRATGWDTTFGGCPTALWIPYTYTTDNDMVTITGYTGFGGDVVVPDTINGLPVTGIGDYAFYDCDSLSSVTIPNSVTSIGDDAFAWCTSLTNVIIPDNVTSIGDSAFFFCVSLGSVTIGNSVTNIGDTAFSDCWSLTGVYFKCNAPGIGAYVFYNDNATVYYLPGTMGWDTTFGGCPTAPWYLPYPLILNGPSFGVQTNGFGFIISWATNISVVVEVCINLANSTWSPVQTNTLTGGSVYFSDPDWTNYPVRYYRLRSP